MAKPKPMKEYEIRRVCERMYALGGQSVVLDYITECHPQIEWRYCVPCEINSPATSTGSCLVCGSYNEKKGNK